MQKSGQALLLMLLMLGLYSLTSCGGGANSTLGSSIDLPGSSADGVTNGGFKAIRYNDRGYPDSALNPTIDLQVSADGATTSVRIAIADQDPTLGACIDLFYDPALVSPVKADLAGLVDGALELTSTQKVGVVSLGQADVNGTSVRNGDFATVTFSNSPLRFASAVGDAHKAPVNRAYAPAQPGAPNVKGFALTKAAIDGTPATYHILSLFAIGNGDTNNATTLGDLTAMVFNGHFGASKAITATDWGTAPSDYDANGETNVADLTPLGQHLGEATTGIEILLADDGNDFATNTGTVVETLTWDSGTDPVRPPAPDTIDMDALFTTWNGSVDITAAMAADTDGDKSVAISARAVGTGAAGPAFTDAAMVITYTGGGVPGVTVTGVDVTLDAATDQVFTASGGDATLVAGEPIVVKIVSITGTFDPGNGDPLENFTGVPSASMTQQDYDDSLTDIQAAAAWTSITLGDNTANEYRTSEPVIDLESATGGNINATVTNDADNPDSTLATTPEGQLSLSIPVAGDFVQTAINYDFNIDVTDDPDAPVFDTMVSDQPIANGYIGLNPVGSTVMTGEFLPGAPLPAPADFGDMSAELVATYASGDIIGGTAPVLLTYTANAQPLDGEFTMTPKVGPPDTYTLNARIPAVAAPGVIYALRVVWVNNGHVVSSSVNYPDKAFASAGDPPAPVTFTTVPPATSDLIGVNDALLLTYPEPQIRRDQRVVVGGGTVTPTDMAGFADIVKATGNSFSLTSQPRGLGFQEFPQVVVIEGNDPTGITSTTTSLSVPVMFRGPGNIVLDVSVLTFNGANPVDYSYKVFGGGADQATWPELGSGTFTYDPTGIAPAGPAGVDFGINAFDDVTRGDLDLAGIDFTDKSLDASSIETSASDVLFIQISNFGFYDFDTADPFDYNAPLGAKNTRLRITDSADNTQVYTTSLVPCAGGLGVNGDTLVMVEFTADMFSKIGTPGWQGILTPGSSYTLTLVDPASPASDFAFANNLTVVGINPNDP